MKSMVIALLTLASTTTFASIKYDQPVPKVACTKVVLEETMKQEKIKLGIHEGGTRPTACEANVQAAKYNWFGARLLEKSCSAKEPAVAKMIADFEAGRKTAEEAAVKTCKK